MTTVPAGSRCERDISAPPNEPMRALYVTCQNWIDASGAAHTLNRGDTLDVTYTAFDGSQHEEFLQFPSERDPNDDTNSAHHGQHRRVLRHPAEPGDG